MLYSLDNLFDRKGLQAFIIDIASITKKRLMNVTRTAGKVLVDRGAVISGS